LGLVTCKNRRPYNLGLDRVTVVKFGVDNRGNDGTGCFRIDVSSDTAEFSHMKIAFLPRDAL